MPSFPYWGELKWKCMVLLWLCRIQEKASTDKPDIPCHVFISTKQHIPCSIVETALTPVNIHTSPYLFSFLRVYLFQSCEILNPFIAQDAVAQPALDNPELPLSTLLFPVQVQGSSSAGTFCQGLGPDIDVCARPMGRNTRGTGPDGSHEPAMSQPPALPGPAMTRRLSLQSSAWTNCLCPEVQQNTMWWNASQRPLQSTDCLSAYSQSSWLWQALAGWWPFAGGLNTLPTLSTPRSGWLLT